MRHPDRWPREPETAGAGSDRAPGSDPTAGIEGIEYPPLGEDELPERFPPPPAEPPDPEAERGFEAAGIEWIARIAGGGLIGTGFTGGAHIVAVHFTRAGADRPEREALIAVGRFEYLYDEELIELLSRAVRIRWQDEPDRS